jgi:hypothetical protein|tara:strand:+ start:449 stop:646 length:198 start_codon:yes stop_codon:yes gene_type:complete
MPKKKLTKAQVKRKLKTMRNAVYDMYLDRLGYGSTNSNVTGITNDKLLGMLNQIDRMQKAVIKLR